MYVSHMTRYYTAQYDNIFLTILGFFMISSESAAS